MVEFDKNRVYRYQGDKVGENGTKIRRNLVNKRTNLRRIAGYGHTGLVAGMGTDRIL